MQNSDCETGSKVKATKVNLNDGHAEKRDKTELMSSLGFVLKTCPAKFTFFLLKELNSKQISDNRRLQGILVIFY